MMDVAIRDYVNSYHVSDKYSTIYIPSKGRAGSTRTDKCLDSLGVSYVFVVEPQDEHKYRSSNPGANILTLDINDGGMAYVRNYVKNYSKSIGDTFHWQLDDDISKILVTKNIAGKNKRIPVTNSLPFTVCDKIMSDYDNIGIASFAHDSFVFSRHQPYELNKQCCTALIIRNSTSAEYISDIVDDTDYSLQLLYKGLCTVNMTIFSYIAPPQFKLAGGNTDAHSNGGLLGRQKNLAKKYPGFFNFSSKDGQEKLLPSRIWRQFVQVPTGTNTISCDLGAFFN